MIVVREASALDLPFVLSTWVESEEGHARLPGTRDEVFAALRGKARALLARSRVLVAAPEDDAITVLAWLCVDGGRVHYAYTRRNLRRHGFARMLLDAAEVPERFAVTCAPPKRWTYRRAQHDPRIGWMLAAASVREAA